MTLGWDQDALNKDESAFNRAQREAICNCVPQGGNHLKTCPCNLSNLAQRAKQITKEE